MIWIFADHSRKRRGRNAGIDSRPALAVVSRPVEIGAEIVQLVQGSGEVGGPWVERRGLDGIDLDPLRQVFRRNVFPMLAGILGHVHQAVVGTNPDHALLNGRFVDRKDGVVILDAAIVLGDWPASWALLGFVVAG